MACKTIDVVILTKSSKFGNYCVAGIDVNTGKWVRLISNDKLSKGALSDLNLMYADGSSANLLDKVQVNILDFQTTTIQPENVLVDTSSVFIKKGNLSLSEVLELHPPEVHDTILGSDTYYVSSSDIDNVKHSLVLVKVTNATFTRHTNSYGKEKIKIHFWYNKKYYSNISVTDPDYYHNQPSLKCAILVISLPDDDWSRDNGYYKFVSKIFQV